MLLFLPHFSRIIPHLTTTKLILTINHMKIVIQRVTRAQVTENNKLLGQISAGYVLLVGIKRGDTPATATTLAKKVLNLRIMADEAGKMNRSILDVKGEILVVSQFTLYADTSGRRSGFSAAAAPDEARELCDFFITELKKSGLKIASGQFGAMMQVELTNDGPVTIILES